MCKKLNILGKNNFGELIYCSSNDIYHLVFKNFHFILNPKQMVSLKKHILELDIEYWEEKFYGTNVSRKIPIPTYQNNLILIFNKLEFIALRELFYKKSKTLRFISIDEIEYEFNLN